MDINLMVSFYWSEVALSSTWVNLSLFLAPQGDPLLPSRASTNKFSTRIESRGCRLRAGWQGGVFTPWSCHFSKLATSAAPLAQRESLPLTAARAESWKKGTERFQKAETTHMCTSPRAHRTFQPQPPFHVSCPAQQCYSPRLKCRMFPLLCSCA